MALPRLKKQKELRRARSLFLSADGYQSWRRERGARVKAARAAKCQILPKVRKKGLTVWQLTLLKMIGVALACAVYHYVGFLGGKLTSDAEHQSDAEKLQTENRYLRERSATLLVHHTIQRFEKESRRAAFRVVDEDGHYSDLPPPPSNQEYMQALNDLGAAGLISGEEYGKWVVRATWAETKSREKAWSEYCKNPYGNLLPFYWYVRSDQHMLDFLIRTRLPLEGSDSEKIQSFITWYLQYMTNEERSAFVHAALVPQFTPEGLIARQFGKPFHNVGQVRTPLGKSEHYKLKLQLDPARCVVQQGIYELCPLDFDSDLTNPLLTVAPEVDIPGDGTVCFSMEGNVAIECRIGKKRLTWNVPFKHVSDDYDLATLHETTPSDSQTAEQEPSPPRPLAVLSAELME